VTHWAALISLAFSLTPAYAAVLRQWIRGLTSASRGEPVYPTAFTGSHCAYQQRDGQAEFSWVAG